MATFSAAHIQRRTQSAPHNSSGNLTILAPHAACNLFAQVSVVLLDCCERQQLDDDDELQPGNSQPSDSQVGDSQSGEDRQQPPGDEDDDDQDMPALPQSWTTQVEHSSVTHDGVLPGSAWLDFARPLADAAAVAHKYILENLTPDDSRTALLLYDSIARASTLADWLIAERGCRRVLAVERAALQRDHKFILFPGSNELVLPSEVVPGRLWLGSAASTDAQALGLLHITAVVSLLDRVMLLPVGAPAGCRHLLVRIADAREADLDSALRQALPFIASELAVPHGRVLVHCEAGQSRSASAVLAALMADPALVDGRGDEPLSLDEALLFVRAQRPCVRPNDGFMSKLYAGAWRDGGV